MREITHVKCLVPFTRLSINHGGICNSCCPVWTKLGSIGKLGSDDSIMDIWNSARIQSLRQAILEGRLEKVCDFQYCPYAMKNELVDLHTVKGPDPKFNRIIDQIMAGRTTLETPPYLLEIANSGKCNLRCIMCVTYDPPKKSEDPFDETLYKKMIPEVLPDISRLLLAGSGEVLYNSNSRKFLQNLDSSRFPGLKIQLLTNGNLLTPKLWESISHHRYDFISVSIDAASKETYEKIRRNGNWGLLCRNLEFIGALRRQHQFDWLMMNFIVMKSNYREMKDFVELGLKIGADQIIFEKIYGRADIRENINLTENKQAFTDIARIMTDPIFNRPEVDTTLINEYRKFVDKPVFYGDRLLTKGKEMLHYFRR